MGYILGITVNTTPIPDPSSWNYEIADLDTSGKRDATGTLHRARVATKINYEFEWKGLTWTQLQGVLGAVTGADFQLTAPDPRTFNTPHTGTYYVGDRTGSAHYYSDARPEIALYSLKLKFIEY